MLTKYAADIEDVREAAARIAPHAHRTPVLTSSFMNELAGGRELFFKCEMFQKVGAFKFRGACNAVMKLSDEVAQRGVVTHSSGNHAQALALAARLRPPNGIAAHIVMPKNSNPVKIRAVEGYGAKVYLCEPNQQSREGTAAQIAEDTGATLIPPYNHPDIIAGQGTVALELIEQVPELDAIIAPIGGGGLMSGICIAAHGINSLLLSGEGLGVPDDTMQTSVPPSPRSSPRGRASVRVFAAEPSGADDAARSKAADQLLPQTNPNTIADGLLTGMGELTWAIVRDHVERVFTVPDERIIEAMRLVFERMKVVIEPSAAVPVAAALSSDFKKLAKLKRVGVVLSGGNVDLDRLPWLG